MTRVPKEQEAQVLERQKSLQVFDWTLINRRREIILPHADSPMEWRFEILHEDPDLLVVNKPAGLVCHPTKADGYSSLISLARAYLGPGSRPHMVNRLDRETSGIVMVAKNPQAAGILGKIWENNGVYKEYLAIVHGTVAEDSGFIDAPLGKDMASQVAIKNCVRADGVSALTAFTVVDRFSRDGRSFSLLRVFPKTGRKHQIRVHLAHSGHPIVGDKLYGGNEYLYLAFVKGILTPFDWDHLILPCHALHASTLRFRWNQSEMCFNALPERWFMEFLEIQFGQSAS